MSNLHSLAKAADECVLVAVQLAPLGGVPLRLRPGRDYHLAGVTLDGSHTLGHFRGRVWCYSCACTFAITGLRVPKPLHVACAGHVSEDTALRNLACLANGELPTSWRTAGWPKGPDFGLLGFGP